MNREDVEDVVDVVDVVDVGLSLVRTCRCRDQPTLYIQHSEIQDSLEES